MAVGLIFAGIQIEKRNKVIVSNLEKSQPTIVETNNEGNKSTQEIISTESLLNKNANIYGTYLYEKEWTGTSGIKLIKKIKLVLKDDNTATFQNSDGMEGELDKGIYSVDGNKITYTKQYYNYDYSTEDSVYLDKDSVTEVFTIIDDNQLELITKHGPISVVEGKIILNKVK